MPKPRSEAARLAVLSVVAKSLASGEYHSLTMEGIAEQAGVAKQTVYRWWASKTEILAEAVAEDLGPRPATLPEMTDDLAADLRTLLRMVAEQMRDPVRMQMAHTLLTVLVTNPLLGQTMHEHSSIVYNEWVMERFERAVAMGEVASAERADVLAEQVLATLTRSALMRRPMVDDDQIDLYVDVLLNGAAV